MFESAEIRSLLEKKRQLLLESEINRRVIALEWTQLTASLNWTQAGIHWLKSASPAWLLLAPVAGFLLVRRFRIERGWSAKVFFLWRIAQRILSFWRTMKDSKDSPAVR